jgi:hypothetical protein
MDNLHAPADESTAPTGREYSAIGALVVGEVTRLRSLAVTAAVSCSQELAG